MDIYGNEAYNIRQELKEQTEVFREMLGVMKKPENLFTRALRYIILIAGALSIFNFFEIIRKWVLGVNMLLNLILSGATAILCFTAYFMIRHMEKKGKY